MLIKAITIENFKGISKPVRIEFKPLTLLFGPNSGGKSTIIQALHYLREILEYRNLDADKTTAGGDFIELGGFKNCVNGHDTKKHISFKIEINDIDSYYISEESNFFNDDINNVTPGYISFTIVIENDVVTVDKAIYCLTNKYASYVINIGSQTVVYNTIGFVASMASAVDISKVNDVFESIIAILPFEFDDLRKGKYFTVESSSEDQYIEKFNYDKSYNVLSEYIKAPIRLLDDESRLFEYIKYGIIGTIVDELRNVLYLGPLRTIPPRNYAPLRTTSLSRWADGLAAWDIVSLPQKQNEEKLSEINRWMGKDGLDTGYILDAENKSYVIPVDHPEFMRLVSDNNLTHEERQHIAEKLPMEGKLSLVQELNELEVAPCDVGVGISQVFPVVVACMEKDKSIAIIEQPELHIHPRLQVKLGDLFIAAANTGRYMLIETHSEHLLLRILRRIRETTINKVGQEFAFTPEQLSILYLERISGVISARELAVSEDGDSFGPWPEGFFEERAEELC